MEPDKYQKALEIAQEAHKGQYRITGEAYVNHTLRVAKKQETIRGMCLGVLHDVIEDCPKEFYDKIVDELPELLNPLSLLTHNTKHNTYEEYIQKICLSNDRDVLLVKLADIIDNLNMSKWNINLIDEAQVKRVERYSNALKKIHAQLYLF